MRLLPLFLCKEFGWTAGARNQIRRHGSCQPHSILAALCGEVPNVLLEAGYVKHVGVHVRRGVDLEVSGNEGVLAQPE